ncbi:MAG: RHS repeat-associated core domain-containing protein, partial [Methylacidiphilales bacterium]|nr:RHS repeat-associated core domain-containing protein [Candidatus Methylacidiphilales bacterium]
YMQEDVLGSVVRVTDGNGDGVLSVRYDAYGRARYFTPSGQPYYSATKLRVGYTGREMLVNTWGGLGAGLYDYRNRIYSTVHGRFLQPDPIGFEAGDVNWYRYVGNGVLKYRDPWGLCSGEVFMGHRTLGPDNANEHFKNREEQRKNGSDPGPCFYLTCKGDELNKQEGFDKDSGPDLNNHPRGYDSSNAGEDIDGAINAVANKICKEKPDCCEVKVKVTCQFGWYVVARRNFIDTSKCGKTRTIKCPKK